MILKNVLPEKLHVLTEIDFCIFLFLISETIQTKSKKSKSAVTRRVVPPLQLDSMGRPIFPLVIGDLTLHSLGEVSTYINNTWGHIYSLSWVLLSLGEFV